MLYLGDCPTTEQQPCLHICFCITTKVGLKLEDAILYTVEIIFLYSLVVLDLGCTSFKEKRIGSPFKCFTS